jgi:hypothetical protein
MFLCIISVLLISSYIFQEVCAQGNVSDFDATITILDGKNRFFTKVNSTDQLQGFYYLSSK